MFGPYSKLIWNYVFGKHKNLWYFPPKNRKELEDFVGTYTYVDDPDKPGFIRILGNWKEKNIIKITLPIKNPRKNTNWTIECHKKLESIVYNTFSMYKSEGFEEIYPIKQLGCFVPRHKMLNPARSLSLHAYGIAIDINWKDNPIGSSGNVPANVVTLFKQYGFSWGGWWTRPKDPMHFEFYKR